MAESITKFLENTRQFKVREGEISDEPSWESLLSFLYGVVKSIVWHEMEKQIREVSVDPSDSTTKDTPRKETFDYQLAPEDEDIKDDFFIKLVLQIVDPRREDPIARSVTETIFDGYVFPCEIAEQLDISVKKVNNAKKRIKRRLKESQVPEILEIVGDLVQ